MKEQHPWEQQGLWFSTWSMCLEAMISAVVNGGGSAAAIGVPRGSSAPKWGNLLGAEATSSRN